MARAKKLARRGMLFEVVVVDTTRLEPEDPINAGVTEDIARDIERYIKAGSLLNDEEPISISATPISFSVA